MIREKKTIELMIQMYCAGNHAREGGICPDCAGLLEYAMQRLDACPFGEKKTTCAKCSIHCYSQPMRAKVTSVMRYSGPRMVYKHPISALFHTLKRGSLATKKAKKGENMSELTEHTKCRHCGELGNKSTDNVSKYKRLLVTVLAGIGALLVIVLIFMGTASLLKGPAAIKYDNRPSPALKADPVKADYVKKYITVTDFGTLEETVPGSSAVTKYFYGTIKNSGDKAVIKLTLAIYYFNKSGRCIAEGTISPILGIRGKPNSVNPGGSKDFKLPIIKAIPEWSGRFKEKVSDVELL